MDNEPREHLCRLIASRGYSLCALPQTLDMLLRQSCGQHPREVRALMAALKHGIVSELQHAPDDLPKMIVPLLSGAAEAVIGSRLLTRKGMPWYRVLGNFGLNLITFFFFGIWTTDSQSGLRAFSRHALERIEVRNDRMEVSSEFIREIRRKKLKFAEVPIQAIYTDYSLAKGQSNWNAFNIIFRLFLQRILED